jgi:FdhD protein
MSPLPQITGDDGTLRPLTIEYDTITCVDGREFHRRVRVCREESIRIMVNGTGLLTMTMSPAELAEFACGYLISEGLVPAIHYIEHVHVGEKEVRLSIPGFGNGSGARSWTIGTSGGMGIIVERDDQKKTVPPGIRVSRRTIFSAMERLNDYAVLWKETGGTHCTVLFDERGEAVVYSEDMGRHNSLDKVIGKAHLASVAMDKTFIVCSGRMPAGMVSKIWRAGIPIIITNNAPSAAGIELAREVNLTLAGFVRPPRMVIYSGKERIVP